MGITQWIKNNKMILAILAIVVVAIVFLNKPGNTNTQVNKPGDSMVAQFYDKDGNLINPESYSFQTYSTIGATKGIYYVSFITIVNNTGLVPIQNVRVSSSSPTQLTTAYSAAVPKSNMTVGQMTTFNSTLINITQFEGQTVTFKVNISADYVDGNGVLQSLVKANNKTLTIQPDICTGGVPWNTCDTATKPDYCSAGTIIHKASVCGCPTGYDVVGDECVQSKCTDGTIINTCTSQKPQYCNAAKAIVNQCATCGCPTDYYGNAKICQGDGTCLAQAYSADFVVTVGYN